MRNDCLHLLFEEADGQPEILDLFAKSKLPKAPRGSVLVGAGDSFAAALAGFYFSKGRCLALDPYSLIASPEIAKGREVFFVSVSGRTSSNVAAAMAVAGLARGTTAITADVDSRLAAATKTTIVLPMTVVPRSPGLLSFSLSLLSVLKIVAGDIACEFAAVQRRAVADSRRFGFGRGTTYFLGNAASYAVSLYAAAKVYELLGGKAHAELLEEFSHLQLFSLEKSDAVNILSCFDPSRMASRLNNALSEGSFESHIVRSWGSSDVERLFHSVFSSQLAVLGEAQRAGLSRPHFLKVGEQLKISDSMIY